MQNEYKMNIKDISFGWNNCEFNTND